MAKKERSKRQGESARSQPATTGGQPEESGKLPAEQERGERIHDRPVFRPRVDIYETENGLALAVDLPGVAPDGLEVTLENRVLSIYGRVDSDALEGFSPIYREYEVGDYERQFTLSGDFDVEGIKAELRDGVLNLAIPRAPKPEAKRIQLRSAG
jgi:HSP20 family protein